MDLQLVPTLIVQRDLYAQRRTMARFRAYLHQMIGADESGDADIILPISGINPLGREHCLAAVQALIALDAEAVIAAALDEAFEAMATLPGQAKVCINLLDDARGGWTDRYLTEAGLRLGSERALRANRSRSFVIVPAWSSETYTPELIRRETLAALYRHATWQARGLAATLGDLLLWEGMALRFAGAGGDLLAPALSDDALQRTREVVVQHLEATGYATQFAVCFGDEAAAAAGYPALGVPERDGFALAVDGAKGAARDPIAELVAAGSVL